MIFTIVIPAYNEENAIASIIQKCLVAKKNIIKNTSMKNVEIIVVNDGSTDKTYDIASRYDGIKVINHKSNRGYGAALKTGITSATGDIVGFLDADGTCDPENFIDMCNALDEQKVDIVIGSRLNPKSNMPRIRRIGNYLWVGLLTFISGKSLTDAASGMRIFRKPVYNKLLPLPDGLHFTPAMSTRAILDQDISISEIPISYDERIGKSKLNVVNDGLQFLKVILEISLTYKPLKFFGTLGFILLGVTFVYSIFPVSQYIMTKSIQEGMIYRLLAILVFFIAGLNSIILGVISNNIVTMIRGVRAEKSRFVRFINKILRPKGMLRFGFVLGIAGCLLNYRTIYQYLSMGRIDMHWSYLVVGGGLILAGFQFVSYAVLQKLVDTIRIK